MKSIIFYLVVLLGRVHCCYFAGARTQYRLFLKFSSYLIGCSSHSSHLISSHHITTKQMGWQFFQRWYMQHLPNSRTFAIYNVICSAYRMNMRVFWESIIYWLLVLNFRCCIYFNKIHTENCSSVLQMPWIDMAKIKVILGQLLLFCQAKIDNFYTSVFWPSWA